ncbi:hypothetical protein BST95_07935 [Halioglobus japonicus]|nr:hypothetical protein BST95_07935 [Halioglobus japonicus]
MLTMGVLHHSGDTVPDPSLPLTGVDSRITKGYLGYLRTISLFGRSANFIVELPYSDGNTRVEHEEMGLLEQDYKGVGDISATLSINLLGAPTMSREELTAMREAPSSIVGAILKVVAPTGSYDNDQLVNAGANRWALRAEVGYMLPLQRQWLIEVAVGAWMFGDNDDFLGLRREQDDVYTVQAHLVHRFSPGFWASLDLNGYRGGRSKIDGRRLDDLKRDSKYGATVVWPVARGQVLKFSYAAGSVNDAEEDFDVFSLNYQRLF